MAKINLVEDVGVPLAVSGVNIGMRAYDSSAARVGKMQMQPIVGIAGVAAGYFMQLTNRAPVIGNRIAVSSFPAAAVGIYDWIKLAMAPKTSGGSASRYAARTMSISADPLLQYKKGGL